MELTQEQTTRILGSLKVSGFEVLSFGNSFENPFEEIDESYFNEIVNRSLEGFR